jgi:hypothetical protein
MNSALPILKLPSGKNTTASGRFCADTATAWQITTKNKMYLKNFIISIYIKTGIAKAVKNNAVSK